MKATLRLLLHLETNNKQENWNQFYWWNITDGSFVSKRVTDETSTPQKQYHFKLVAQALKH